MKEKNTTYYLIWERTVAKREQRDEFYDDYLFRNGSWIKDENHVVMDHLVGYDLSEPEDSPYRFGSTDVLMEMDEISEEEAISIINQQVLSFLKTEWKDDFKKEKEEWGKSPKWPAKLVETTFKLNGIKYAIEPFDIGLSTDPWDQGFMESIQSDIESDLREYGATDIGSWGFLD